MASPHKTTGIRSVESNVLGSGISNLRQPLEMPQPYGDDYSKADDAMNSVNWTGRGMKKIGYFGAT